MKLVIENDEEVRNWIQKKILEGNTLESIKGNPPPGATYDDGDLIVNKINIGWLDVNTKDAIYIKYKLTN